MRSGAGPQEPIRQVPDYRDRNKLVGTDPGPERVSVFVRTREGMHLRLSRAHVAVVGRPAAHRWASSWIPRQGDVIDTGEAMQWRVAHVAWQYPLAGAPRVTVVVDPFLS